LRKIKAENTKTLISPGYIFTIFLNSIAYCNSLTLIRFRDDLGVLPVFFVKKEMPILLNSLLFKVGLWIFSDFAGL